MKENHYKQWRTDFEAEINQAITARLKGNEGRARVCARRAAGIAIAAYLHCNQIHDPTSNAYIRLKYFANLPQIPEDIRQVVHHFLLPVDTDFRLPAEIDLIAEAQWLANTLNGAAI